MWLSRGAFNFESTIELGEFDRVRLERIRSGLDLLHRTEAKDLHVRRPEELLVVARVHEPLFDAPNGALDIAHKFPSVSALELSDLCLVVEDGVLEYLLNVFVAYFRRFFPWRAQVLPTVHCQVDLCVPKVLRLVI